MRTYQNILVTGGAGFIGCAFLRGLFTRYAFSGRVVTLDALTYAGNVANLRFLQNEPRHVFIHGSIIDAALVETVLHEHHIDLIVNFAAETHVDRSIVGPRDFVDTNIIGTHTLLEAVRKRPTIHLHQVSTDEVYGDCSGGKPRFSETTPYDPRSPYSASKAAADHLVRAYAHTYDLSVTLSNCSNNYGPYQFPEKLIPLVMLRCLQNEPIPIYGDGQQVRDWLYVDDHADAVWKVATQGARGETYNVGGDCELPNLTLVKRLLNHVAELTGRDPAELQGLLQFVADRPGHDRRYAIDGTKIATQLRWSPQTDIDTGLRRTVSWYLENRAWLQEVQTGAYRQWIDLNYGSR